MASLRDNSLFSTIKCSLCNADVEISQMGDHVCMPASEGTKFSNFPLLRPKPQPKGPQAQKPPGHITIDPFAANGPFRDQLTPTSSSAGSRVHSPATPQDGQPLRTPIYDGSLLPNSQAGNYPAHQSGGGSPPSSNYNTNSPFPHFKSAGVSPVSPPSPGACGAYSRGYAYALVSPLSGSSKGLATGKNDNAPGSFELSSSGASRERVPEMPPANSFERRPSGSVKGSRLPSVAEASSHERDGTRFQPRARNASMDSRYMDSGHREEQLRDEIQRTARLGLPAGPKRSQSPGGADFLRMRRKEQDIPDVPALPYSPMGRNRDNSPLEPVSPYPHRTMKSEAVQPNLRLDGLRLDSRSQTFPVMTSSKSPGVKQPPHPGLGLPRSPSQTVRRNMPRRNKSSSNLPKALSPPPDASLPALPTRDRRDGPDRRRPSMSSTNPGGDTTGSSNSSLHPASMFPPPPRRPPRADEYSYYSLGNPYDVETSVEGPASHIPSPSMSSNASSVFSNNTKSSRSSLSDPAAPSETHQAPKVPDPKSVRGSRGNPKDSDGMSDIDGLMEELRNSMQQLQHSPVQPKHQVGEKAREENAQVLSHDIQVPPPPPATSFEPPPQNQKETYASALPQPPPSRGSLPKPSESRTLQPASSEQPRRKRRTTPKGNCRGCNEPITGKSISSADGRLTGRYHKACFVCQTCRKPFQSAEFYVLGNLPYCQRHYHELNRSLCPSCDRGIEGRCLETEGRERFHPNCFRCFDCRCELGGDYFEINRRPYCERHAYRIIQGIQNSNLCSGLGPSRGLANMERRRTRLMFM